MRLWPFGREERAAAPSIPVPLMGTTNPFFVAGPSNYAYVDGSRIEAAKQSVAISSAVDLVASIVSELPIDVFSGQGGSRRDIKMPAWLQDPAGDGHGVEDWIYQGLYSWLYRGNLYGGVLARSNTGFIQQATLFHPDAVSGYIDDKGLIQWSVSGTSVAQFNSEDGVFLHRRVNPVPGQVIGESVISRHARQIGLSLSATNFGKSFFDADAMPIGILRNTLAGIDPDQSRTVKDRFMASVRGTREPVVMGRGWEFDQLTVNPEESQFLQTMGYTEAQCARMFGPGIAEILGYPTGQQLTYVNLQDRDIQLLKYAVNRWARRMERLLSEFLPNPQYVVFNRDALLETNTLQRFQAYTSALTGRWMTVNEVRDLENEPPVPWGDEPNGASAPAAPADPNANATPSDNVNDDQKGADS